MNPHDIVFLSASVPNRPEWVADSKPIEIEEAVICLARAVFARGGRLLFGGHPSISPLIAAVAGEYFPVDPTRQIRPVITFQSKFFRDNLPNETWELYRMGWASIEWTPEEMRNGLPDRDESLNAMRRRMLLDPTLIGADREMQAAVQRNLLGPPKAMVAIGGMEGIAEEAAMFLDFRSQWEAGKIAPYHCAPLVHLYQRRRRSGATPGTARRFLFALVAKIVQTTAQNAPKTSHSYNRRGSQTKSFLLNRSSNGSSLNALSFL